MKLLAVIGFSLPFLCPLHAFAFPSVSLFWRGCNLKWINNLRSDYPLNSVSAEWSYFGPLDLGQSVGEPLRLKPMLLLGLHAEASRAAVNEICPDYAIPVCVNCPRALSSLPKSQDKNTFRDDLFSGGTPISRKEPRRPGTAQPRPLKCLPKWQTIRQEPSRFSARTDDHFSRIYLKDQHRSRNIRRESSCRSFSRWQ